MEYRKVLDLIAEELGRAETIFPGFPEDPVHAATVLGEEAGEVLKAALKWTYQSGSRYDMEKEAVQAGAMAVRFLLNIEKMKARPSVQV